MQDEQFWLTEFEQHRPRMRGLAYRMLGSLSEADDALQESWLRIARASGPDVDNPAAWLTTVVSRQCLNQLRQRGNRREEPLLDRLPDPVVESGDEPDPSDAVAQVDSVSIALLVVLEALDPAERLAFVLHDLFAVPFEEIAAMVDRSPAAARQLASRARRRVQGRTPNVPRDRRRQRELAEAWVVAARGGDLQALIGMLHPDAVLRVDSGRSPLKVVHGAANIAGQAAAFRDDGLIARFAVVNGGPGLVSTVNGRTTGVLAFTVRDGLIIEVDILIDPERLARLALPG